MLKEIKPNEVPISPQESQREKFKGMQEWGDLINVIGEVSNGIDDILSHAERIFRTYDMGSPFANERMDLEIPRKAGKIIKEMKDRTELKGHY